MISIFPIIALSFINFILPPTDINQILKITTGAMVFPIILMGMNTYAINISAGIDRGDYNYYKIVSGDVVCILIVKLLSGLVMTLPSVFITANFGSMINNINLTEEENTSLLNRYNKLMENQIKANPNTSVTSFTLIIILFIIIALYLFSTLL